MKSQALPEPAGLEDIKLAQAFYRAWRSYYVSTRTGTTSEQIALDALTKHLVTLAKKGVTEEDALADGGLLHLISLTQRLQPWSELKIEGAGARFTRLWQIRMEFTDIGG